LEHILDSLTKLLDEEYKRTNYKHIQFTHKDISRMLDIDEKTAIRAAVELELKGKVVLHYEADGGFNHMSLIDV